MQILITGAHGFVGKNLIPFLHKKQHETLALSLRNENWQNEIPSQAEVYIHLAGKAHDLKNTQNELDYFVVNCELTKQLFNAFLASEARDFIYFSSVKAIADQVPDVLVEDATPDPKTPYGKSKLYAENYLNSLPLPAGKRLFIIRPCMIHGPGNKGNLNLLYKFIEKGIPYPLLAFDNKRSFLSIQNLSFLVNELISKSHIPSNTFQMADDDSISTSQLVAIIQNVLQKKPQRLKFPKSFIKFLARIGDKIKLPLNTERLQKLTENYVVSNQKIKTVLGLKQLPQSTEDGLRTTIRSFRNNLNEH